MNYKEFFNNKKVAVIGLGPHGEMIPDIKFLLRNKAKVHFYDMRSEKRLKAFLPELREIGLTNFSFGKIDGELFLTSDLILLSPEISKKSFFLKKAISAEIQIEYPDTLFFKLSPPITLIGVMGLYGKTIVSQMIYSILKKSFSEYKDQGLFFIDPDSTNGALTHLKKIKKNDVVLARIPDTLVGSYRDIHISPHVAVVTSDIDFDVLNYQTYNNFIVAPDQVVDSIKFQKNFQSKAKILRTRPNLLPSDWNLAVNTIHDKDNYALVLQTCELFKITPEMIKEIIQNSTNPKGSIEFIKKVDNIEYYNDANSSNPDSTLSALKSISSGKNIVLILGGAYTGHDYTHLLKDISKHVSSIILLPGSGSLGIRSDIEKLENVNFYQVLSLDEAVKKADEVSKRGDKVLFSPAFDAVGIDISRKERGEKFVKSVRSL